MKEPWVECPACGEDWPLSMIRDRPEYKALAVMVEEWAAEGFIHPDHYSPEQRRVLEFFGALPAPAEAVR